MAFASLLLVVLASLIHASWNLLAKRAASVGPIFVFAYNMIACVAYAPWVAYLLIQGDGIVWTWAGIGFVVVSGLIHLAYSLCLQRGYQVADLSVVYPVARGTGPMLSTIGAFLILGEIPSAQGVVGLLFVVAGIGLIATQGDLSAFRRPGGQAGVRWGAATGGLIASYTVVDAYAVKALGIAPVVLDWFSNLLRFFLLAPLAIVNPRRAIEAMRGYWWIAIGVGLLSPLSYILVLAALTSGAPLSLVAPMREMSMMVGALMGMLILREKVGSWRLVGCGVLIAGVILLSGA
ncbi:DMT family transporter [Agrobacterium vitis]|uniref:DMT family transporter n=1 Tax=Agrobacterium vitis TaxID=373 RepID=UPI001574DA11|nr:DMT family transporter [Agrobacterium vitis]NSZ15599.1 EamA family transporter [Agrobacterium vitis]UJL91575.1 EamA family transporter [Agrobacterium vitis]